MVSYTPMAMKKKFIKKHKDGSVWAKGFMDHNKMVGVWVWFRKDGSKMRSGSFEDGKQVGKWTTYGKNGKTVRVTDMDK
jgi:antitoxin component YwqK of YwqJK toxin-antitoxin module